MNSKVKPSEVLNNKIQNLINGRQHTEKLLTELLQLGAVWGGTCFAVISEWYGD